MTARNTTIVNIWAGAGAGKSTTAAQVFATIKMLGVSCELITEYVKQWAWRGDKIGAWDDVYLFAKQLRRESCAYGKVDYLITDSPLGLGAVYEQLYKPDRQPLVAELAAGMRVRQIAAGIKHVDCFLVRTKPYVQAGRYEDEKSARYVDELVEDYLATNCPAYAPVQDASGVLRAAGL